MGFIHISFFWEPGEVKILWFVGFMQAWWPVLGKFPPQVKCADTRDIAHAEQHEQHALWGQAMAWSFPTL